jgi:hypothetical protein
MKLATGFLHHTVKAKIKMPVNSQMSPAIPTEMAGEEEMEGCLLAML